VRLLRRSEDLSPIANTQRIRDCGAMHDYSQPYFDSGGTVFLGFSSGRHFGRAIESSGFIRIYHGTSEASHLNPSMHADKTDR
jgi:hypothetical protein